MDTEGELEIPETKPLLRQLCRYLSERSPQPTVAVEGLTHVVIYVNPAFARFVGRDRKDLVGRPIAEAVPEGEGNGCLALLDRVFQTGVPENLMEQEHRHTQPKPVYWSYAVWPILGEDDHPAGVMIQVADATEIATYRQQVVGVNEALVVSATRQHELTATAESLGERLQASLRTRDHFLAILSHELRNPLAALCSGVQLLKLAGKDPAAAQRSVDMMERQLNQMVRLVDDLLDVSRITTGKLLWWLSEIINGFRCRPTRQLQACSTALRRPQLSSLSTSWRRWFSACLWTQT